MANRTVVELAAREGVALSAGIESEQDGPSSVARKLVVLLVVRSGTALAGTDSYSNLAPAAGFEPATSYLQIRI